ncbi:MAG: glycosyltransferase family 9 protein [Candidatus Omnitrophica bacterium]|nr:glycosyltransferase family 9 protein [Candidatus Omnitrophota bacterium]
MISKYKKTLVISLQGIGDLLLTTPLLRGIKENIPESKLSVLTFKANKDILSDNPYVDDMILVDPTSFVSILKVLFELRERHFDLTICAYPSGLRSAFLGYLSGAPTRFGQGLSLFNKYHWLFTKQTPITEVKHAILMNLDFLRLLNIDSEGLNYDLTLNLDKKDKKFASEFLNNSNVSDEDLLITIHIGGGKDKAWSKERFAQIADELIERYGARILFLGSKKEFPAVNSIIQLMKNKSLNLVSKTTLMQMAALLEKSHLLICNNSGPMHIAAALKIPTISISGPVDPRIHRPWGQNHIVLQKALECSPCYYPFFRDTLEETKSKNRWFGKRLICKTNDFKCLASISINDVLKAVETLLLY